MARLDAYTACEDCHRTAASRPRLDVGVSRRQFIALGIGTLTLYAARSLPVEGWLAGAEEAAAQSPNAPILVSVFLPGGLDLLDSLVPLSQYARYRDLRGSQALPPSVPRLGTTGLGVHPSMTAGAGGGIKGLFDAGKIGFIPGIDYANPDLSHFHSRHFWETGLITPKNATGWLGRWLDLNGSRQNPFQGLTSGYVLSPVLASRGAPVCSVTDVHNAVLNVGGMYGAAGDHVIAGWQELAGGPSGGGRGRQAAQTAARLAGDVSAKLRPLVDSAPRPGTSAGGYPTGSRLGSRLQQLAFLLSQPFGVRVATVNAEDGFDTHATQGPVLTTLLADVSKSLTAFQADIEARGLGDRVLTFVWSEFGRRARGNASAGTDHGAGGVAWVQGTRAARGMLTEYPNLTSLDDEQNLKVTVDFRSIYASLVEQWLGTDGEPVIPNAKAFSRVKLVR